MYKSVWKKSIAWGMALTMMLSLTACGGKKGNEGGADSSSAKYGDVKNMVFSGEEVDIKDVKGDINNFVVNNDKIYFYTMEWPETEETDEPAVSGEVDADSDISKETSEESADTTEEADKDGGSDKEDATEESTGTDDTEEADGSDTKAETSEEGGQSDEAEDIEATDIEMQATVRLYSMNLDATGITEICEFEPLNSGEYIQNLLVDKEGNFKLYSVSYDMKTESNTQFLSTLTPDGKIENHTDITKQLGLSQDVYISKVIMDGNDNYIIVTDQSVIILDSSLNKVAEVKNENGYLGGEAVTPDGSIVCGSSGEKGTVVQVLDVAGKKFGDKYELDINYFNGSDSLINGNGEFDFYYKDQSGVFGYSMKDKKTTKLLDYLASEINSDNTYSIIPINAETMLSTGWTEQGSTLTVYKKVDPSAVKDKVTITYGSMWSVDDSIRNAAIKFNKESDNYRIEFKDYSDSDDPVSKMNADIIAGNIPDIIDLSNLPVGQYVAKGILEDLTPYYEKDDKVKKEDILPSIAKAMEIDGKMYYISSNFNVISLIASKKDVGDKTGWTFDEFKQLLDEKGEGARPFYSENKSEVLYSFLGAIVDDYIDWTTGKCNFNGADFKSVLEIANRGTNEETDYSEDSPSEYELIKSGKVLLSGGWLDVESIQLYKKMYNSDITFIGYPCEDKQGSYFNLNNMLGIYSKSDKKDGAWEFIKTFMTKDYQANGYNIMNVPTNKDAFENYMKTKTTTKPYKDEYGNDIEPLDSSWGYGDDLEVKIGPLSADEEKMYRDLINNTTKISGYNNEIMDIINEEAKNYFNGQKGLDETADIIQNRVTTFVNENR